MFFGSVPCLATVRAVRALKSDPPLLGAAFVFARTAMALPYLGGSTRVGQAHGSPPTGHVQSRSGSALNHVRSLIAFGAHIFAD